MLTAILVTTTLAWVTKYSDASSCHNKRISDNRCQMASGYATQLGAVACPKRLPFGTIVEIKGKKYWCGDRYADWVQTRQSDTFDIFTNESIKESRQFGRQRLEVKIILAI